MQKVLQMPGRSPLFFWADAYPVAAAPAAASFQNVMLYGTHTSLILVLPSHAMFQDRISPYSLAKDGKFTFRPYYVYGKTTLCLQFARYNSTQL